MFYVLPHLLLVTFLISLSLSFNARQLLYGIAEDLTPDDVRSIKFLLQEKLPKNKLQDNAVSKMILISFLQS